MSASSTPLHPGPPDTRGLGTTQAAIDLLVAQAHRKEGETPVPADAVHAAASLLQNSISDLQSTQAALAEALIASQDRLLAVKTLAQVNVQSAGSDAALELLLDQALVLTGSSQMLLFEEGRVSATRGDVTALALHTDLAQRLIAESPGSALFTTASDSAMISTLDTGGGAEHHVAFFRPADRPFSTTDVALVEAVNSALGVRLAFTQMHRRELEQAAVESEHRLASTLAQSIITGDPPLSSTIDIFARTVPASLTGGDFYVFGQVEGSIWFAVGDVAGKGLPAAMLMIRAVSACRVAFLGHRDQTVVDVFERIEDELFDHLDDAGLFLTLAMGTVDETSRAVSLVNAGHSPVVLVRGGVVESVPSSVPPLGVVRRRVPKVSTFTLVEDDRLLLGSDGLVEQSSPEQELFGYDRFSDLCRASHRMSPPQIGETVFATLGRFAAGTPASDDSTLVVLAGTGGAP